RLLQSRSISGLSSRSLLFRPATSLSTLRSTRVATTQDSVRGCRLHIAAVAIAGDWIPRAFKAQPSQIRACRFPAPGSPGRPHGQRRLDSRMTRLRVRQLEPRAAQEIAPVQPMTLAASAQYPNPLPLNLAPNIVEL